MINEDTDLLNMIEQNQLRLVRRVGPAGGFEWMVFNNRAEGTDPDLRKAIKNCLYNMTVTKTC